MREIRQLVLRESPYCEACPINSACHEGRTDLGCSPDFVAPDPSNSSLLHPTASEFAARMAEVNDVGLDIAARPQRLPMLPAYIPRIQPGRRMADWLARNPCVSTIAIDLQTADTEADWRRMISDIGFFSGIVPDNIRCLFSGVGKVSRIKSLRCIWPRSTLCNYHPSFNMILSKNPARFHDEVLRYTELMDGAA